MKKLPIHPNALRGFLCFLPCLLVMTPMAGAVTVEVEGGGFGGSDSDLINNDSPDLVSVGFDTGTTVAINDGSTEIFNLWDTSAPLFSSVNTFDLNVADHPLGYSISRIETVVNYSALGVSFVEIGRQDYQRLLIEFSTVASADYFELVSYEVDSGWPDPEASNGYRVVVSEPGLGAYLATGVDSLRFTILDPRDDDSVLISELDVFGRAEPVPEPGVAMLGGMAAFLLLARRRRHD